MILDGNRGFKIEREAFVQRLLGDLDPRGRMVRLLVGVKDPMGILGKGDRNKPLLIGSYVKVEIEGTVLEEVYALPRHTLRAGDNLWVKNNQNKLEIRKVEILNREAETIIVGKGLEPGEEVVTSPIVLPLPGMSLQTSRVLDPESS